MLTVILFVILIRWTLALSGNEQPVTLFDANEVTVIVFLESV
ncbi:hypothetical protein HBNXHr_2638 [Halorhabdus sp. BNX81]|nr:hypothetical protein HBNXHr_2638 [Halorhabdus sp. BNX81]